VKPTVAVVGRPNVGKSTLVNRILGRREAIVQELPGVTRDRVLYPAEWQGREFMVVDTGGLEKDPEGPLAGKVAGAATAAAHDADVVVFVVDAVDGITAEDRDVATLIRKLGNRVVLVANKADNAARERSAAEFYELGLGDPLAVSALHGRGVGDLLDAITQGFEQFEEEEPSEPRIAIVGRPNVGKSSLFNALVGTERSIVHDEPGTTRDAVDTVLEVGEERFRFVDTAGLRKIIRVDDSTEYYGVVRTMKALDRCDVALLVIDAAEGVARQDLRIAEEIAGLGRSAVVLLNKADLLAPEIRKIEREETRRRLPHLGYAPLVMTSATTGEGIDQLLPAIRRVLEGRSVRIPTPLLNAAIDDLQARTPIPSRGVGARVKYAVQAEVAPPTIVLFGSGRIPDRWLRYMDRGLRERFGFEGTPIRFVLRGPAPRRGPGARRPGSVRGAARDLPGGAPRRRRHRR
jgi:GTP-binding protein